MDAEQQSSSLVPSAQNSVEPINSQLILEPSISDYPTEILISEFFMDLSFFPLNMRTYRLSDQDLLQKPAKQKEAKTKHEERASTSQPAQPEPQLGKKQEKKGFPESPAKQAETVDMTKALHRQKFYAQEKHLFHWAENTSLNAIQSGLYIGWRCPHYLWDCFQIGDESKCFCGHLLKEHKILSDISVPCSVSQCRCLMFCFIPSRPEEVGEFWLRRRAFFDPKAWRALCRCKHSHEEHLATGGHPCRVKGCCCVCFESNFLCAACDRRWEEHGTFFETEDTRRRGGRPHGEK
ncbi:protein FAM221B [Sorex araneus]|uniref:protein FAM221B n=1 Tax=Sorex araneus TaxID=42254 RepID=UPI00064A8FD2|nr:protein FAM221B [Sorex araneus]